MDILRVEHLVKSFGRTRIIKDISFSVGSGEIVGFVGPNGAGKTTTLKLVTNLIFPDSGRITVYRCFVSGGNGPEAFESAEMVNPNPVIYLVCVRYARKPPAIAVRPVRVPVIDRISPKLPCL